MERTESCHQWELINLYQGQREGLWTILIVIISLLINLSTNTENNSQVIKENISSIWEEEWRGNGCKIFQLCWMWCQVFPLLAHIICHDWSLSWEIFFSLQPLSPAPSTPSTASPTSTLLAASPLEGPPWLKGDSDVLTRETAPRCWRYSVISDDK